MNFFHALFLSVVQGVTEFLPISSSAHLVFLPQLFGWEDQGQVFDIALHLGTLLAVILYFRKDVWRLLRALCVNGVRGRLTSDVQLAFKIGVATLPIVIFGFLLKDLVDFWGRLVPILATSSIVFGMLLWWADQRPEGTKRMEDISWREAVIFGVFQALAIVPGTSRSGICMTGGRLLGYSRDVSGRFASLLAIPTILLAGGYSFTKVDAAINWQQDAGILFVGIVASALTALFGIHLLMTWLTRIGYWPFVIYRVVLGVGLWMWFLY